MLPLKITSARRLMNHQRLLLPEVAEYIARQAVNYIFMAVQLEKMKLREEVAVFLRIQPIHL